MDISTYLLIAIAYIPLNIFDLYIISQYMNALYGFPRKGPYLKSAKIISVIGLHFFALLILLYGGLQ